MEPEPVRDYGRYSHSVRAWVTGRGLLATHTGLFVVAATALTLFNIVRSPTDLWVWQPLLMWAIVLTLHAALVAHSARTSVKEPAERRVAATHASIGTTVRSAAHQQIGQVSRTLSATRGRLIDGTPPHPAAEEAPTSPSDHGWAVASRTWHGVPVRRTSGAHAIKDHTRRAWQRLTAFLKGGGDWGGRGQANHRSPEPIIGDVAASPVEPPSSRSVAAEPAPTMGDTSWPRPGKPSTREHSEHKRPDAPDELVPAAVEALWSANGAAPARRDTPSSPPVAPATNGDATWPEKPVLPSLASPTIRLLMTPAREPDVVGYQQPSSPAEDVVLSGPAPRIEQPRQWSELQEEAAAWLARREADISKPANDTSPSILTPGANGHHPPKRAQG